MRGLASRAWSHAGGGGWEFVYQETDGGPAVVSAYGSDGLRKLLEEVPGPLEAGDAFYRFAEHW